MTQHASLHLRSFLRLTVAVMFAGFAAATGAQAQTADTHPVIDNFGSPGLLDMPSAHSLPDGTLAIWLSGASFARRYGATFQVLPWLEGSFRYIGTSNFFPTPPRTEYDRSFGMRIRLQDETDDWPDITVGIQDIAGTSLQSGEYLVASKHEGPFDFTLGMGWGRLAGTEMFENPFILLSQRFATRAKFSGLGDTGQVQFGQFFRGPDASLFGGIAWSTPVPGLRLLAEYSSDTYRFEAANGIFKPKTQYNFGVSYQALDWLQFGAGWMYGSTASLRAIITMDPAQEAFPEKLGPMPTVANIRSEATLEALARRNIPQLEPGVASVERDGATLIAFTKGQSAGSGCAGYSSFLKTAHDNGVKELAVSNASDPHGVVQFCATDAGTLPPIDLKLFVADSDSDAVHSSEQLAAARKKILELAAAQSLEIDAVAFNGSEADVAFSNTHYRTEPEAYGRLARILMAATPDDIEMFRLVSLVKGVPVQEIVLPRSSLERVISANGGGIELLPAMDIEQTAALPAADRHNSDISYPRFDWAIVPEFNQSLFDPNQPYRFQLLAGVKGGVDVLPGWRFEGELQANLVDSFNGLRPSNSLLPHVRSDFKQYFSQGKNGIAELQTSYIRPLGSGFYAMARAGYLESMFTGAGGEVLWRPDHQRWAVSVSLYDVWQRGFDRLFDLQKYHVLTGHVNLYYASPYYGLNFELNAGRYLAGDHGATFQISRRFDTGVEIGVFATLTNVPFAKFGEGSFDKGFILRIPIDWAVPLNSQSEIRLTLRPLTRDGGQMLSDEQSLYDTTQRTSYGETLRDVDDIVSP